MYNKSSLSPSEQFEQMMLSPASVNNVSASQASAEVARRLRVLRAVVRENAWLDEKVYAWASIQFSHMLAAQGLSRGGGETSMECRRDRKARKRHTARLGKMLPRV